MAPSSNEHQHALTVFERMGQDSGLYTIRVLGKEVPVLPGVFSPKYFSDVKWFAKEVPKIVRKRSFLEIGTGTGIIALFTALHGAGKIVATDINRAAVHNARKTFHLHKLKISVRHGDMFQSIQANEKFDVIFWNHPFHYSRKKLKSSLLQGGFDYRYESLRAFFAGAKEHLTENGEVLLGTSKNARLDLIKKFGGLYGYRCILLKQESIPSERRKGVTMDVRIYSFRPKQ